MKLSQAVKRRGLMAVAMVILHAILGFLVLPPILKGQLEKRLSAALGRRVTIERIRFNPYALAMTVENLGIAEANAHEEFAGWRRLYVRFDALASLRGEWVLGAIELDGVRGRVRLNADHSFNFSDVLAKFAAPPSTPSTAPGRPIRVITLRVTDARLDFTDLTPSKPFTTTLGSVAFELNEFSTAGNRDAAYRFAAVTEAGETLTGSGSLRAAPWRSTGEVEVVNLALPKYTPYLAGRVRADLVSGRLTIRGGYEVNLAARQEVMRFERGALQLRELIVQEAGNSVRPLELRALDLEGIAFDAGTMKAAVASAKLAGGHLRVERAQDGTVNLLTMLPSNGAAPAIAGGANVPPGRPPEWQVGELALQDFQLELTDLAAPRPVRLGLSGLQLAAKNVTVAEGARIPVQLAFQWAPQGQVSLDGHVGISPFGADLNVALAGVQLLPLSPILEQFVNARLTQGAIDATLAAHVASPRGQPLSASATGEVTLREFGLVDGARNEELAGFGRLAVRGLRAGAGAELTIAVDEVELIKPYARVAVESDRSLNLARVTRSAGAPKTSTTSAAPTVATPPPKIEIGKITIGDGELRFKDASLEPNVTTAITRFGGVIGGISSAQPTKAAVDLKAMVDGSGPVGVSGHIDPFGTPATVKLQVDMKNVDLLPLSPYSGKYAGYELARGKLAVDVKLAVDGKKIDATNVVTLNQFTFGRPVASPDATGLPVRLAIALLKDLDGKIVIDLPVQGQTDDPDFRIGRVVLRVVVNLLTKAAVSPFALLGAAFGGGGDELAFQEFTPGTAELRPTEIAKLQTMVKALTNRPGLSVALEGAYDTAADAYALKRVKLSEQVRRTVWERRHAQDPNIAPPDQLVVSPEEKAAMVKELFTAKFPPGTQFGVPLPPAPAVVAPPPPPAGFFKRLVSTVTFAHERAERKAAQENARQTAEHAKAVAAASAAGLPYDEMFGRLAEATTVDANDLRALARARAERVRAFLAEEGKIAGERLFLAQETAAGEAATPAGKGPRVFLQLQ